MYLRAICILAGTLLAIASPVQSQEGVGAESLFAPFAGKTATLPTCTLSSQSPLNGPRELLGMAAGGDENAMALLGFYYVRRNDPESARAWFERAAATGKPDALWTLGMQHYCGRAFPKDRGAAIGLLKQAAVAGSSSAARVLGHIYELGDGVPVDKQRAAAFYSIESGYDFARALYQGIGMAPDPQRAFDVLLRAVRDVPTGSDAAFELALMYTRGIGTARDQGEAERLLRMVLAPGSDASEVTQRRARALLSLRRGPAL